MMDFLHHSIRHSAEDDFFILLFSSLTTELDRKESVYLYSYRLVLSSISRLDAHSHGESNFVPRFP